MQQQKSQLLNAENSGIQWTIQYLCTKHNIQNMNWLTACK